MERLDARDIGRIALTLNCGHIPAPYGIGGLIPPGIKNVLKWKSVIGLNRELKKIHNKAFEASVAAMLLADKLALFKNGGKNAISFFFSLNRLKMRIWLF